MKASGMKNRSPQTRLAMAFPLVTAGPAICAGDPGAGAAAIPAPASLPQTRQKRSCGAMAFPQAEQKESIVIPKAKDCVQTAEIAGNSTLHFARRQCEG